MARPPDPCRLPAQSLPRRARTLLLVVAALALGGAPLAAQQPAGSAPAALPSVTLPPALDRVLRDYERAWRAADADGLAALFTDDGLLLQPSRAPVRGRAAIRAAYAGSGGGPLRLRALHAETSGDAGFIIGAYGYGDAPGDMGKFTLTLRRGSDGRWLIVSDMDNGTARQP